jgi:MYXO-CTERM domain-containing protein
VPPFTEYLTQVAQNDRVAPTLTSASIELERAEDPDSGGADCSNMGKYRIRVDASDDQTARTDLGFALRLVDGTLPFTLPEQKIQSFRQPSEDFSSWFSDNGEEFAGTIEVRIVDRAGNLSEPVNVRATGDAVGCGCSMAGATRPGAAGWLGAFVLLSLVRRRVRKT